MNSIHFFATKGIEKIYDAANDYIKDPSDFAGFIGRLRAVTSELELGVIRDTLEMMDEKLRDSKERKEQYSIIKRDKRSIITSLGVVSFKRTYFEEKATGDRTYLLDEIIHLDSRERLTEDARVRMLTEVTESSYRKSGEMTCLNGDQISRQTVKNEIHSLEFPEPEKPEGGRKSVKQLYIDADEDHVALQYLKEKGDVQRTDGKYKNNGMLNKLVYVYEGIGSEGPKSRRRRLIEPYYFSGSYGGSENEKLWDEVGAYIENHYDLGKTGKIYLNADGGTWIAAGKERIRKITPVLDEFHLSKYLVKMTHFLGDSAWDARRELKEAISVKDRKQFQDTCEKIRGYAEDEKAVERIRNGEEYILSNWDAAVTRMTARDQICGCSAEGHVSHVLSSRMSSRPMGWSRKGADRMARLLAYRRNGRDLLELVRYQDREKEFPKAAGAEEMIYPTVAQILRSEKQGYRKNGKYFDRMQATISYQNRRQAGIQLGIWI